jgi:hypothetical protein
MDEHEEMTTERMGEHEEITERMMSALLARLVLENSPPPGLDKAIDNIVKKAGRFDGRNATQYLHRCEAEMLLRGISNITKLSAFNRVCTLTLQGRITDLQVANATSEKFKESLLSAFSLDDLSRVTRRGFEDWVSSTKRLSLSRVLSEFEDKFAQLSTRDRTLLMPDRVMLFLQAVDVKDRKDLGLLLEDPDGVDGLVSDWETVKRACSRLSKRQQWLGESSQERIEDDECSNEHQRRTKAAEQPRE